MKKNNNLLSAGLLACLLMIVAGCSDQETVTPPSDSQAITTDADGSGDVSAKKQKTKVWPVTLHGNINGIPFLVDFHINRFISEGGPTLENGTVYAVGTLHNIRGVGLPSKAATALAAPNSGAKEGRLAFNEIKIAVSFPEGPAASSRASATARTCDILFLQLAPLDLNLLGLTVHLNQVLLDINAVTGGNALLGNLLCALTGILDGVGTLADIVGILNDILAIIGTIV